MTGSMKPFVPKRLEHFTFCLLLSGMMSFIISGLATMLSLGLSPAFPREWLTTWIPSWAVAFPAVLVLAPLVRRILARIVIPG